MFSLYGTQKMWNIFLSLYVLIVFFFWSEVNKNVWETEGIVQTDNPETQATLSTRHSTQTNKTVSTTENYKR